MNSEIKLAPSGHPLAMMDYMLLSTGWTHSEQGFLPPEELHSRMKQDYDGVVPHLKRKDAIYITISLLEHIGFDK
jgi:hypothetical protein